MGSREGREAAVSLKDVVVYIGLNPPDGDKRYKVTHRVNGVEPGPKPDEVKYMLKDAGYPFVVPGGSAFEDVMVYFHADWFDYKYERCIDEQTIVVPWEELKSKLGR
jgi:hypothetical protein